MRWPKTSMNCGEWQTLAPCALALSSLVGQHIKTTHRAVLPPNPAEHTSWCWTTHLLRAVAEQLLQKIWVSGKARCTHRQGLFTYIPHLAVALTMPLQEKRWRVSVHCTDVFRRPKEQSRSWLVFNTKESLLVTEPGSSYPHSQVRQYLCVKEKHCWFSRYVCNKNRIMQACPPSYFTRTRRHLGKDFIILMELQSPLNSNGGACRSAGTIVLAFPKMCGR